MKTAALLLALYHPQDVIDLTAFRETDGTVLLDWTLPADPTVEEVWIYRYEWNDWDVVLFRITGPGVSFEDDSALPGRSYRYWVHTVDAEGDLSDGVYIDVFSLFGDDDDHHHHGTVWCWTSTAASLPPPWAPAAGLILAGLAAVGFRRRVS